MPGLAIAEAMRSRGWQVHWLATRHGIENRLVPASGIPMTRLNFSGLRGKGLKHSVLGVLKLAVATYQSWQLMGRIKPSVVLGMGGYVTVPGGYAAWIRRLPLALINADAALLMSNRALARMANLIMFGFECDMGKLGALAEKSVVTGNPIRREITTIDPPEVRYLQREGRLRLLVVGGSLGARPLNETLPEALSMLPESCRPIVTHQSGAQHIESLEAVYRSAGVEATVVPFIDDMATAYANADVLVCRAGAITVSEIATVGVASILVPLMISTTSHQRDNAQWMEANGAAFHLPQAEMTPTRLARLLQQLDREQLLRVAQAAKRLGRPAATDTIADQLESLALAQKVGGSA